jgi:hypothetical protein
MRRIWIVMPRGTTSETDNNCPDCLCCLSSPRRRAASKGPFEPGLGEFMTATQLRHAKLWFAGKQNNWDLAAYEIDEIKEGLEDAARLFPTFKGIPVAEMIKTIIDPRIDKLEVAVRAKSSAKFTIAFDELTSGCNTCHVCTLLRLTYRSIDIARACLWFELPPGCPIQIHNREFSGGNDEVSPSPMHTKTQCAMFPQRKLIGNEHGKSL